jgi:hypothetical protein
VLIEAASTNRGGQYQYRRPVPTEAASTNRGGDYQQRRPPLPFQAFLPLKTGMNLPGAATICLVIRASVERVDATV